MKNRVRLGIAVVTSPLEVGADEAPALLTELRAAFEGGGYGQLELLPSAQPVVDADSAVAAGRAFYDQRVDAICIVAASWYEDYLVLDMLEECQVPVIAWARPGMETGSLCGMQQLGFMLKQLDHPFCSLFGPVDSESSLQRAWDFARAAALQRELRRARIGYLGHRVEGMTETTAHELALKRIFGPRVVGIDSKVFLDQAAQVPLESVRALWEGMKHQVGQVTSPDEAGLYSMQVYTALKQTVEDAHLSAVAAGCYPHLMGKVCLAASLLGEEGVPVACEGDVNGALGMLMLTRLTGEPVHNTDLLDPVAADDAIVFSHCGSGGFSLAQDAREITLGPVRLMDEGVCALFLPRTGRVTLVNIVPSLNGYRLAVLPGEAVETDMVFPGNPLKVRFDSHFRQILEWIAREGLGHHWMAAYGDLSRPLNDLAHMAGCEWVPCP